MKQKRHIKTRILFTLIGLTCAVLLSVALAFNLSVQGYISSRVSAQLSLVSESASESRKSHTSKSKHFDDHPDRVTGTRGNAILVDKSGELIEILHGDRSIGAEVAAALAGSDLSGGISNKVISTESGSYAVSSSSDPEDEGQLLLAYVDVTSLMAFSRQLNLVLLIIILVAILLAVLLSRHFARTLSAPVQSLSAFAAAIGSGNLTPEELTFREVEFDELAGAMNKMAAELREAKTKQETFFQNVSHELRTPLTSIRGNAEGIVYGIMEPVPSAKTILTESDRLSGLVEDLLYLSRMGKAVPEGTAQPLDLRETLSLCAFEQRADAQANGVSFAFDFDDTPVLSAIREEDVRQMFGNLLSNAIRYAKSSICLTCHAFAEKIVITVADDGPGIAEADLPHIFERFYKAEGGKHGIGLSIAKSAAEKYGGTLEAKTEGGAVFTLTLPSHGDR